MNDPKSVILSLSRRWLSQYGETLGTEEIRRHLSRILTEVQKREIEQVFANWTGEEISRAIEVTFDLDNGEGIVAEKALPLIADLPPVEDIEYIPLCEISDVIHQTIEAFPKECPTKKRGRPAGAKNKANR